MEATAGLAPCCPEGRPCPQRRDARVMLTVQSRPTALQPEAAISESHSPPPFAEDDGRNNLALVFANEAVEHLKV